MRSIRLQSKWPTQTDGIAIENYRLNPADRRDYPQPKGDWIINAIRGAIYPWVQKTSGHFYVINGDVSKLSKQLLYEQLRWMCGTTPAYSQAMIIFAYEKFKTK